MQAAQLHASLYNRINDHPGNVACTHNNTEATIMTTSVRKRVKERTTSKYRNIIARSHGCSAGATWLQSRSLMAPTLVAHGSSAGATGSSAGDAANLCECV
ncbi:hypothetical protein HaLaN_29008 [Haematococcus lacustris]|uniref:Uncharacterized protein n=1 Tax=Haematococcus lacustris TaxID=44745 RepID=A0A6A0ADM2_HAELA|nr:hypothetical protein HaLaN_29008 [Haematococcus lacustris]